MGGQWRRRGALIRPAGEREKTRGVVSKSDAPPAPPTQRAGVRGRQSSSWLRGENIQASSKEDTLPPLMWAKRKRYIIKVVDS